MRFTKMHGAGNDYVYVWTGDQSVPAPALLARAVSDRHTGVGSDGLILIDPGTRADFRMRMYNADGSEGEMCGNGIRCIGKYVYDHGLTKKETVTVETKAGTVDLYLHVRGGRVLMVTVDMGPAQPVPRRFFRFADGRARMIERTLRHDGKSWALNVLSMGNPHCVIFVPDVDRAPVETIGPAIENHAWFPQRTNVEFVEVKSRTVIRQRTWERGSGETLCCGSGACAAAAASFMTGRTGRGVADHLRGGRLSLEIGPAGAVHMTGPAVEVFSGEWPNGARR